MAQRIYCWEFTYYSSDIEEETECTYYTYSDNPELAIKTFQEDEGDIEYALHLDEVVNEETMVKNYGDLNLVLENLLQRS